jgi:hypothetical protein
LLLFFGLYTARLAPIEALRYEYGQQEAGLPYFMKGEKSFEG